MRASDPPGDSVRRLSLERAYCIALAVLIVAFVQTVEIAPNDFWWHVKTGETTLAHGAIPTVDTWSFTSAGRPWVNQAWLMQIALYLAYSATGAAGVLIVHALTIGGGYVLLLAALARVYGPRGAVAGTLAAALLGLLYVTVRPQSVSFLALGALVAAVELHRHGRPRALYALPLLFAVWANAHGGFVFGIVALGCYVLGALYGFARRGMPHAERRDTLLLAAIGLLSLAAPALNPEGPAGLLRYVLGFYEHAVTTRLIVEFQPLTVRSLAGACFFAVWACIIVLLARAPRRLAPDQVLSLALFSVGTLLYMRVGPWLGFVIAPVVAAHAAPWLDRAPSTRGAPAGARPWVYVSLAACVWMLSVPPVRPYLGALGIERPLLSDTTPVGAAATLCARKDARARVYAAMGAASYLVWACPGVPLFLDTRVELYSESVWREYLAARAGRYDWQDILDRHRVTYLLLDRADSPHLIDAASTSPVWQERYADTGAVLFERRSQDATTLEDATALEVGGERARDAEKAREAGDVGDGGEKDR